MRVFKFREARVGALLAAPREAHSSVVPTRILVFSAIIFPLLMMIGAYVVRRVAEVARLSINQRRIATAALWSVIAFPFVLRGAGLLEHATPLVLITFGIGLATMFSFAFLLPIDALYWLAKRFTTKPAAPVDASAKVATAETKVEVNPDTAVPLTRREAIRHVAIGASVGMSSLASGYGIAVGRHDYVIEEVPIPLLRLPRTLDGYTIAQISDIHIGSLVNDYELGQAEELIRRTRADLIVITGDMVDHDASYIPRLGEFTRRLAELGARDGVVAIPGNHDYYADVNRILATTADAGARVLRNEGLVIPDGERSALTRRDGFSLLGIDDVWASRGGFPGGADLPRTLSHARPDLAKVMLCHNPELFPEAAEHIDLMLSGHTHGGQIALGVRPASWALRHGYVAGHYHRGASQIYVNRGFGTVGPPARLQTPPEITKIILTSA